VSAVIIPPNTFGFLRETSFFTNVFLSLPLQFNGAVRLKDSPVEYVHATRERVTTFLARFGKNLLILQAGDESRAAPSYNREHLKKCSLLLSAPMRPQRKYPWRLFTKNTAPC